MFIYKILAMVERLKKPTTIRSIIVFVFSIGMTYATLNNRIEQLEQFQREVDIVELQKSIVSIQKDVEWIKVNMPLK